MNKKEYNDLLKDYYTENNKNIENWIFVSSTGAITLLVSFSEKVLPENFWLFCIATSLFIITLILQLISARVSKKGCDYGLDENGELDAESVKCFDISEKLNTTFFWTFIIAVSLTSIVMLKNNYHIKYQNQNSTQLQSESQGFFEQTIKAKDFEYYIKKVGNNE